jgi:glycosyltransferase involved in cell wall biosynthesis
MSYATLIPAYNEEKNIREVILRLKKDRKIKIIVIDDGSMDETAIIAKKLGVTLVRHTTRKGKGEAIKSGFAYILKNRPETKYVILLDADLQYLPEEARKLLKPLEKNEADFVTGYRDWATVPFRHRLGNFVWRTTFNLFFGTDFKDTNCGFAALNREALKKIKNIHGGYVLESEMFVDALRGKLRVKQVPVRVIYHHTRAVASGIRVVAGVLFFIVKEGLKYQLNKIKI